MHGEREGAHVVQAVRGGSPERGNLVTGLALVRLAQADFRQVVDLEEGDGVGCRVVLGVDVVVDAEVHLTMRAGVDWRHHLVTRQDGSVIADRSLHPTVTPVVMSGMKARRNVLQGTAPAILNHVCIHFHCLY